MLVHTGYFSSERKSIQSYKLDKYAVFFYIEIVDMEFSSFNIIFLVSLLNDCTLITVTVLLRHPDLR